jgi:hypothetical protein
MSESASVSLQLKHAPAVMGAIPVEVVRLSADLHYLWVSQRYADWLADHPGPSCSWDTTVPGEVDQADPQTIRHGTS